MCHHRGWLPQALPQLWATAGVAVAGDHYGKPPPPVPPRRANDPTRHPRTGASGPPTRSFVNPYQSLLGLLA